MLSKVLLVTRNYNGQCEMNFISTVEEFIKEYSNRDGSDVSDCLKRAIESGKPFEWSGTYYAKPSDSYDMRLCQGPEDLLRFFAGEYNDSIQAMEDRNPGCAGLYNGWTWENSAELCSVLAVESVKAYMKEQGLTNREFARRLFHLMPDFPLDSGQSKVLPLESVIAKADQLRSLRQNSSRSSSVLEI